MLKREQLMFNSEIHPFTSSCRILLIRTPNHVILVSTKSSRSLKSTHANEGAIEVHHVGEGITCFLQLHDDFADICSI